MRVFVAGATGVIGQYLVPGLVGTGHEVTGSARSPAAAATSTAAIRHLWTPAYPSWRDGFPVWAGTLRAGTLRSGKARHADAA